MLTNTISTEVLTIGAKTPLVDLCKQYVKTMRSLWPDYPNNDKFNYSDLPWRQATETFVKAIRNTVGPHVTIDVYSGTNSFSMGVASQIGFNGHSGSRWYNDSRLKLISNDTVKIEEPILVDLQNVKVSGRLVDAMVFRLYYTEDVMFNSKMFTDEEVVSVMLHEFGHIFNTFVTLGDYVWLNYYLTDGIDILLGKKPNKLKLMLLSDAAIKEKVPATEYDNFVNDRNEESAKRVVLSLLKSTPRHHLTQNDYIANKREEQLADLFANRLGYGRALAQFNYKCDKYFGEAALRGTNWYAETAKAVLAVATLPLAVLWVTMHDPLDGGRLERYDDPVTRTMRIRRDLVAQLKYPGPLNKDAITADIDALDDIVKEYAGNKSFYTTFVEFFNPSYRKQRQNAKVENDLESLLHNDLFLQAFKLSKL